MSTEQYGYGRRITLVVNGKNIIAELYTRGNKECVTITPICEAIGIRPHGQAARLKNNPQFNPTDICGVGADNKNRDMICLPVDEVGMWLCQISAAKVKPEVREVLVEFQKHCQVQLHEAITGRAGTDRIEALEAQMAKMVDMMHSMQETILHLTRQLNPIAESEDIMASVGGKLMARARKTKALREDMH